MEKFLTTFYYLFRSGDIKITTDRTTGNVDYVFISAKLYNSVMTVPAKKKLSAKIKAYIFGITDNMIAEQKLMLFFRGLRKYINAMNIMINYKELVRQEMTTNPQDIVNNQQQTMNNQQDDNIDEYLHDIVENKKEKTSDPNLMMIKDHEPLYFKVMTEDGKPTHIGVSYPQKIQYKRII